MNIHVYLDGKIEPVKFYDMSATSRYSIHVQNSGALVIALNHIDAPKDIVAVMNEMEWVAAYDVNHDPNV